MEALADGKAKSARTLARISGLSLSSMSKHLSLLSRSGFITPEPRSNRVCSFSLSAEFAPALVSLLAALASLSGAGAKGSKLSS
ncbi:hypothetical protein [Ensifer adhaerens]